MNRVGLGVGTGYSDFRDREEEALRIYIYRVAE